MLILTEQAWSKRMYLIAHWATFSCRIYRAVLLCAWVANRSAGFGSSCPLAECAMWCSIERIHMVQAKQFRPRRLKSRRYPQYNGEAINTICTISRLHRVREFPLPLSGTLVYSLVTHWTFSRETTRVKNDALSTTHIDAVSLIIRPLRHRATRKQNIKQTCLLRFLNRRKQGSHANTKKPKCVELVVLVLVFSVLYQHLVLTFGIVLLVKDR